MSTKHASITTRTLRGIIIVLATIAALAAGALAAATASRADATTADEVAYIMTLDAKGIPYSSEDAAIAAGHATCDGWAAGMTFPQMLRAATRSSGYTTNQAAYIMGAATAAFCPELDPTTTGA